MLKVENLIKNTPSRNRNEMPRLTFRRILQ